MKFVFDLDDTICATDAYSEKYIAKFIKTHKLPINKVSTSARFAEKKFDWDYATANAWYKKYGDEMMFNFPCNKGAKKFLDKVHKAGHTIIIATARANDWHTDPETITKMWLKKMGIKYDKMYIGRVDKEAICAEEDADFFIDDDLEITKRVALEFSGKQKTCFLMTTDYNANLTSSEGVVRVLNFKDFYNKLKELNIKI